MTYWPVSPALRGLIDDIYVFRSSGPSYRGLAGALLPQAHWQLTGQFSWQAGGGALQPLSAVAALGPSTAALHLETVGDTIVVGFGFYPEGWAAFMPQPAGSATARVLDLGMLWGAGSRHLLGTLDPAQDDATLAGIVDTYMLGRLSSAWPIDPRIRVISEWANGVDHDMAALLDQLHVSQRQAQRLTTAAHGLPPRHLANKHRILRIAAMMARGDPSYSRDVWELDYADQSHFINQFRRYVGVTPARFMLEPDLLVRDVMRARAGIASAHPLGLGPAPLLR